MCALPELPLEVIVHVMRHMEFPERQKAAEVCSRWRNASNDPCFYVRVQPHAQAINRAISSLVSGGTILLSPGYYQETVVVSKPIRIIGQLTEGVTGEKRRGVVIEGHSSTAVVCMSQRFRLEGVQLRTRRGALERSVVTFFPQDQPGMNVCLVNCEVTGCGGLHVPNLPNTPTHLKLRGCSFSACQNEEAALRLSGGLAQVSACTFTGSRGSGILIGHLARAEVQNCELSFNGRSGIYIAGSGRVTENIIWGNSLQGVDLDPEHMRGSCVFQGNHLKPRLPLSMHERIISTYLDQLADPRLADGDDAPQAVEHDLPIDDPGHNIDFNFEIHRGPENEDRDLANGNEQDEAGAHELEEQGGEANGHVNFDLNNLVAQIMLQLNQAMANDEPDGRGNRNE